MAVVVLAWWWWPGLTGHGQEITVVGTSDIESARQDISRRLREEGFSVRWSSTINSWCDLADEFNELQEVKVVLSPSGLSSCRTVPADIMDSLSSNGISRWVVIDLEMSKSAGDMVDWFENHGARAVSTERLLGAIDEALPCVWWEDCDSSGQTVTRTESGLTADGRDRLARLITAAVV